MTLAPFFEADLAVQVHVVFALLATISGFVVFSMRKGTRWHKRLGRAWFVAMGMVALSSFFIHQLKVWGMFSPLHLLSVFTLATLVFAIVMVRRGNIAAHQRALTGLFLGGIVGAGILTLSRGLLMSRILFPDGNSPVPSPAALPGGPVATALGVAVLAVVVVLSARWSDARRVRGAMRNARGMEG